MDFRAAIYVLRVSGLYSDEAIQEAIQHLAGIDDIIARLDRLEKCVVALVQLQEKMVMYRIPGPWDEFINEEGK